MYIAHHHAHSVLQVCAICWLLFLSKQATCRPPVCRQNTAVPSEGRSSSLPVTDMQHGADWLLVVHVYGGILEFVMDKVAVGQIVF